MTPLCTANGLCAPALYLVLLVVILLAVGGVSWLLSQDRISWKQWALVVWGMIFVAAGFVLLLWWMGVDNP